MIRSASFDQPSILMYRRTLWAYSAICMQSWAVIWWADREIPFDYKRNVERKTFTYNKRIVISFSIAGPANRWYILGGPIPNRVRYRAGGFGDSPKHPNGDFRGKFSVRKNFDLEPLRYPKKIKVLLVSCIQTFKAFCISTKQTHVSNRVNSLTWEMFCSS